MSEEKKLTLKELLENTPEELNIPGLGVVTVKTPTIKDRIEAKEEARKIPGYDRLPEDEKRIEEGRMLARRMLVSPKISFEDYLNSDDIKMGILLDTVSLWYAKKLKELNDKRRSIVDDFLQQMKEG